jgi:D-lactate dehydrogenase (cytochrome)
MHEITSIQSTPVDVESVRCIEGFAHIKGEFPLYLSDESKLSAGAVDYLFFPSNESELCAVVKEMGQRGVKLTIAGARTGLVGGCVPMQGALISLEKLNRILDIRYHAHAQEWRVQAGCAIPLGELNQCITTKTFPDLERNADGSGRDALTRFQQDPAAYFYPPDPTETSASLGGTVATNASGARTYRYGPTRDWVRGLRVILANGEILSIPRGKYFASPSGKFCIYDAKGDVSELKVADYPMPRTKSTSGLFASPHMDLIDLFIGSEGTLGIITAVEVGLLTSEPKISIVLFLDSDEQAITLAERLRENRRLKLDLMEFYSQNALDLLRWRKGEEPQTMDMPTIPEKAGAALFIEMFFDPMDDAPDLDVLKAVVESVGADLDRSWAGHEPAEMKRFRHFRHMLPETVSTIIASRKKQYPGLHRVSADLAVPDEHLRDMWQVYRSTLDSSSLQWLAYGHIGNNHVHVNVLPRDMQELEKALDLYGLFARKAVGFGGAVSAEHGIGKIKTKFLRIMYNEDQLSQMRAMKKALDPGGILSPGNIFSCTETQ